MTAGTEKFDKIVGRVAGAIYGDIVTQFPEPPFMLIPPVTFKVRKVLENFSDIALLSWDQKQALAEEIRVAIVPMLFSYELDAEKIGEMAPIIESAVMKTLTGSVI